MSNYLSLNMIAERQVRRMLLRSFSTSRRNKISNSELSTILYLDWNNTSTLTIGRRSRSKTRRSRRCICTSSRNTESPRSLKRSIDLVHHGLPCSSSHQQRSPRALGATTAWHWLHSLAASQAPPPRTRALHRPPTRISCSSRLLC